ncbi:hypothetical protein ACCO45_003429 [Purpureocillium lilacinum]|uniref:Uncharacterized protein n=1 Tax=Purpureocillium lilacinum TaxID=33203 RepID=A0ACC4DZV1_PURLI
MTAPVVVAAGARARACSYLNGSFPPVPFLPATSDGDDVVEPWVDITTRGRRPPKAVAQRQPVGRSVPLHDMTVARIPSSPSVVALVPGAQPGRRRDQQQHARLRPRPPTGLMDVVVVVAVPDLGSPDIRPARLAVLSRSITPPRWGTLSGARWLGCVLKLARRCTRKVLTFTGAGCKASSSAPPPSRRRMKDNNNNPGTFVAIRTQSDQDGRDPTPASHPASSPYTISAVRASALPPFPHGIQRISHPTPSSRPSEIDVNLPTSSSPTVPV